MNKKKIALQKGFMDQLKAAGGKVYNNKEFLKNKQYVQEKPMNVGHLLATLNNSHMEPVDGKKQKGGEVEGPQQPSGVPNFNSSKLVHRIIEEAKHPYWNVFGTKFQTGGIINYGSYDTDMGRFTEQRVFGDIENKDKIDEETNMFKNGNVRPDSLEAAYQKNLGYVRAGKFDNIDIDSSGVATFEHKGNRYRLGVLKNPEPPKRPVSPKTKVPPKMAVIEKKKTVVKPPVSMKERILMDIQKENDRIRMQKDTERYGSISQKDKDYDPAKKEKRANNTLKGILSKIGKAISFSQGGTYGMYRFGGIIPDGVLHTDKNMIGDKGIPVVPVKSFYKEGGSYNRREKLAEIEKEEIMWTAETAKAIDALVNAYDECGCDMKLVALGKLVKHALRNTIDETCRTKCVYEPKLRAV